MELLKNATLKKQRFVKFTVFPNPPNLKSLHFSTTKNSFLFSKNLKTSQTPIYQKPPNLFKIKFIPSFLSFQNSEKPSNMILTLSRLYFEELQFLRSKGCPSCTLHYFQTYLPEVLSHLKGLEDQTNQILLDKKISNYEYFQLQLRHSDFQNDYKEILSFPNIYDNHYFPNHYQLHCHTQLSVSSISHQTMNLLLRRTYSLYKNPQDFFYRHALITFPITLPWLK